MLDNYPTVCAHGLGYVGLPTVAVLLNLGYEAAPEYWTELRSGKLEIDEQDLERFVKRALYGWLMVVNK